MEKYIKKISDKLADKDIKEARKIIAKGENLKLYEPKNNADWEKAYKDFKNIINK